MTATRSSPDAYESTYGAAVSIVVVLIWAYYTSQIILMGTEVTHSYAKHNGSLRSDAAHATGCARQD